MRRELARVLPSLTYLALLFGGEWLLNISTPARPGAWATVSLAAWVLAALAAGTVAHELAHAGAVRLAGERVLGIEPGGRLGRVTFRLQARGRAGGQDRGPARRRQPVESASCWPIRTGPAGRAPRTS